MKTHTARTTTLGIVMALLAGGAAACSSASDAESPGSSNDYSSGYSATSGGYQTGAGGGYGTGPGSSATTGSGMGVDEFAPPPSSPPPEEQPPEVTCDGLPQEPLELFISADDSNSMGSPVLARAQLAQGFPPSQIRVHEFLNYYSFDYPAPEEGMLGVFPELAAAVEPGQYDLQIGVRAFDPVQPRRPMTITLVLDTSGSMAGEAMTREQDVVRAIAGSLQEGDIVNAVTWAAQNSTLLSGHSVSGPNDPALLTLADDLVAGGGTDLHGGLTAGYGLAEQHYGAGRINRVVLVSDGGANMGVTSANLIAAHSEDADQEGIYLVGVGLGPSGQYHDQLMDAVTDEGRGAYVFVDTKEEADRIFGQRFEEVMEVAARAVQVKLTLPWYFQMHKFYGEEYSTNPEEVDPQHLAPGDSMVFNQVLRACDPAIVDPADGITVTVNWEEPLTYASRSTEMTTTVQELLLGDTTQLRKGKAIVAYAEALREADGAMLSDAVSLIDSMSTNDPELLAIKSLIESHPAYSSN